MPLLGTDPALAYWGSKAGSRELFSRCGLAHPDGSALVHSFNDLVEACAELVQRQPDLQRAVVKLNEGFSGEGNAPLELADLERSNAIGLRQQLSERLEQLAMPATGGAIYRQARGRWWSFDERRRGTQLTERAGDDSSRRPA